MRRRRLYLQLSHVDAVRLRLLATAALALHRLGSSCLGGDGLLHFRSLARLRLALLHLLHRLGLPLRLLRFAPRGEIQPKAGQPRSKVAGCGSTKGHESCLSKLEGEP